MILFALERFCLQQLPSLKYQLPSEPNVYVDLVDDEDTQLMFDDWHDYSQSKRDATCKLHLFIDWRKEPSHTSSDKQGPLGGIASVESLEAGPPSAEQMSSAGERPLQAHINKLQASASLASSPVQPIKTFPSCFCSK